MGEDDQRMAVIIIKKDGNIIHPHLVMYWLGCNAAKYANMTNMPPT